MMQSRNTTILWMLYGFVVLTAILSVLEASVYAYMHYGLTNGYMIRRFSYYIPCFAGFIYGLTAIIMVFISNRKTKRSIPISLPKVSFIIGILIAMTFQIFTERVSDWHLNVLFDDLSKAEYMSSVQFGQLFDIVEQTTFVLRWLFIIIALLFLLYRSSKSKQRT